MNWNYRTLVGVPNQVCPIESTTYLDSQGLIDSDVRDNYCQFVSELIENGVYSFCKIIYPALGTSALTNNLNAVNPIDSDAAFRRRFFGGFDSFSPATGIKGDGTTGYFRTYYNTSNMTLASGGGMVIEILSEGTDGVEVDAFNAGLGSLYGIEVEFTSNAYLGAMNTSIPLIPNSTAVGTYMMNRPPSSASNYDINIKGVDYSFSRSYVNPNAEVFGLSRGGTSFFSGKSIGCIVQFTGATTAQAKLIQQAVNHLNSRR